MRRGRVNSAIDCSSIFSVKSYRPDSQNCHGYPPNEKSENGFDLMNAFRLKRWVEWHCRYIELVKKHGLEVSQPSLDGSRGTTWAMTKHRGDVEVHKYVC